MSVIKFIPSVNFSDRPPNTAIDTVVLHHTVVDDTAAVIKLLTQEQFVVSAHYLIDYDGSVIQLVDESNRARHAGKSHWRGKEDLNDFSIGIEIVNDGLTAFSSHQIQSAITLCQEIMVRHPVDQRNIVGHSDVAPDRKVDPSHLFEWETLAKANVGIYSHTTLGSKPHVIYRMGDSTKEITMLRAKLHKFGYNIAAATIYDGALEMVVSAFKRHYCKETYDLFGWDTLAELRLNHLLEVYYE